PAGFQGVAVMASNIRGASLTRRNVVQGAAAGVLAAGAATVISKEVEAQETKYDAIVIGTGFGGSIATFALSEQGETTLVLERGTFGITPETLGPPPASRRSSAMPWRTGRGIPSGICGCSTGHAPITASASSICSRTATTAAIVTACTIIGCFGTPTS